MISAIIGIYATHRIALVEEPGDVEERVVLEALIAETRRNVRTVSTVDGLRHTFQVPLKGTKKTLKRKKKSERQKITKETDSSSLTDQVVE